MDDRRDKSPACSRARFAASRISSICSIAAKRLAVPTDAVFDELRLMVFPVLLGSGKHLFGEHEAKKPLGLVGSETVGDGVGILTYERPWT